MKKTNSGVHHIPSSGDVEGLDEALRWVVEFKRIHGRNLRVLHIGNIANNAYNNARIQREFGIEADVLSYDYYHIMGCPEWEDADFNGDIGNTFFPDWWATSLRGWRRPEWFANGPADEALRYLLLRRRKPAFLAKMFRQFLEAAVWRVTEKGRKSKGGLTSPLPLHLTLIEQLVLGLGLNSDFKPPLKHAHPIQPRFQLRFFRFCYRLWFHHLVLPGLKRERESHGAQRASGLNYRFWAYRWRSLDQDPTAANLPEDMFDRQHPLLELYNEIAAFVRNVVFLPLAGALVMARRIIQTKPDPQLAVLRDQHLAAQRERILSLNIAAPPSTRADLDGYITLHAPRFFGAMREYDIIQGYSIDGFIPMLNGIERYVCYEHGTLRDLPFEEGLVGIACRESYLAAPWSLVTNSDVLPSVNRLGLDTNRVVCLPHAFNDGKLRCFRKDHSDLRAPDGPVVLFCPTRHDWTDKSGGKGNDILLRAAGRLAREGIIFKLVLVEWGQDVAASKALIDALDLDDHVSWVAPMKKNELWAHYCKSHAVLDQFILPALGGVGFETMALGRRLITALDRSQCDTFYGKAPPCLDAFNEDQCAERIRQVIADPEDCAGLGHAASKWIENFHSARLIVARQSAVYRALIHEFPLGEPDKSAHQQGPSL